MLLSKHVLGKCAVLLIAGRCFPNLPPTFTALRLRFWPGVQALVPLTIFRPNSKLYQNLKCYGLKRALLITTQFCTRHGRDSAKFCDRLSLSWTTALQILIEFRNTISGTGAWRGLLSQCTRAHSKQLIKSEAVKPRDLKHCLHKPNCIVTTNPDRSVLITIITWHFQFQLVNVFSVSVEVIGNISEDMFTPMSGGARLWG